MYIKLQPSVTQKEIFKQTGITSVEHLMYADLRSAGWTPADAFYAVYRDNYNHLPKGQQKSLMKQIEKDIHVQKRIMGVAEKRSLMLSPDQLAKETSKEKILSDLIIAREQTTTKGSKEWSDITKMIADIAKVKQDDLKTDEPITYHLPTKMPRRCEDCVIYQNKTRKEKEKLKDLGVTE